MNLDLKKQENENDEQFIWRICQYKDSGLLDASWDEVADIINKELDMEDTPFTEAAFRKPYQQAKRFYDAGVFNESAEEDYVSELRFQRQELEKEKVKVRDERNELRRMLREEARKESFKDQIIRCVCECGVKALDYDESKKINADIESDNDLIVTLSDLHTGINIDNFYNTFNGNVLKQRLNSYLDKIFKIQTRHNSENATVVIGEIISGLIHTTLRIENNQNVIEQFLTAIGYISEFLMELSYKFKNVSVFVCPGNHSRIIADKESNGKGENFDNLIVPFLESKLQNFLNIKCYKNEVEESIAMFNMRGHIIMAAHGDKDSPSNVVQKFTMMFGVKPEIVILGHRHTNALDTVYDSKVLTCGCVSGGDNYCLDKRLRNRPEQIVAVINEDDCLECFYDIKF